MCVRVSCKSCGKATYSGCGAHVEQVLRGVPEAKRCQCKAGAGDDKGRRSKWWPW